MKTETDNKTKVKKNKKNFFSLVSAINAINAAKNYKPVTTDVDNVSKGKGLVDELISKVVNYDKRKVMQSMTFDDLTHYTEEQYIHMLLFANVDRPGWRPAECKFCSGIARLLEDLAFTCSIEENFTDEEKSMTQEEIEDFRAYIFSIFRSFTAIKENLVACTKFECKYIILKLYIMFEYYSKDVVETENMTPESIIGLVFFLEGVLQKLKTDYGDQVSFDDFPKNPHPKYFEKMKGIDLNVYFGKPKDSSDTGVTTTDQSTVQPSKKSS